MKIPDYLVFHGSLLITGCYFVSCIKYIEEVKEGLPFSILTMNECPEDQLGTSQLLK